jgi:hypothetical protein
MASIISNQAWSKCLDTVRNIKSNSRTSNCQCILLKKIQLSELSAYLDGSASQLIQINGVLFYSHFSHSTCIEIRSVVICVSQPFSFHLQYFLIRRCSDFVLVRYVDSLSGADLNQEYSGTLTTCRSSKTYRRFGGSCFYVQDVVSSRKFGSLQ